MNNQKFLYGAVLSILAIPLSGPARGQLNESQLNESQLRDKLTASTVVVEVTSTNGRKRTGTGWVLSSKSKQIMTACHGVEGAVSVEVIFPSRNATGWVLGANEVANSPRHRAEVKYRKKEVDLAILRVSSMPNNLPQLNLADSLPSSGSSTYIVGHLGDEKRFFQFLKGKIESIGFAVAISDPGGQPFSFWSDTIAYKAKGLGPGTSGGALVNAAGDVIGVAFCQLDGTDAMCKAISVREIKQVCGEQTISKTKEPKSIIGRWVSKIGNSDIECGMEFTPDKRFSLMTPQLGIEGMYRATKSTVFLKANGQSDPCKIEWLSDDAFTLSHAGNVFTCHRYDAGWEPQ
jgi:S1-C subfamily serine protease